MYSSDKKVLRSQLKDIRASITEESRNKQNLYFLESIRAIMLKENTDAVLTYLSVGDEADTKKLIEYLLKYGVDVYIPKTYSGGTMEFYRITSIDALKMSIYHIPEPEESLATLFQSNAYRSVLTVVPGLGFDRNGYRIGYGGGFYDRYISKHKAEIGKIVGLCFSECLCDEIPHGIHDIPVNEVVCPIFDSMI